MPRSSLPALLVLALTRAAVGQDAGAPPTGLTIGSPAPPLAAAIWVRGERPAAPDAGRVLAIEFWATWCGPCVEAFPHLSDLAEKWSGKVCIVGMNAWDHRGKQRDGDETAAAHRERIAAFVAEQGDHMRFDAATDDASGTIARTWMTAAGRDTIPCTFVIDRQGHIAWIGHPRDLDAPLAAIVDGTWDLAAFKTAFEAERERARAAAELRRQITTAARAGDHAAFDQLLARSAPVEAIYTAIESAPEFGLAVIARLHGSIDTVAPTAWCSMCAKVAELASTAAVRARAVATCADCAGKVPESRGALAAVYQARCANFAGDAAAARSHLARARTLVAVLEPAAERQGVEYLIGMTERALPAAK
ncbi:MAG: TlpA disulfide reductase family protein [Planctomycetota bacterium]